MAGNTTFTFVFSESVGNSFSVEDLVVTGGAPSNFTKVSATTYTVDVTPTTAGAAVTVSLAAGKVFDLANNPNAVAASKTYDPNAIVGTGNTGACVTTSTVNCFGFEDTSVLFQAFEGLASAGTVVDPAGGTNKVLQLVKVPLVGTAGSQPWAGVTLHTSAVAPFTSPAIAFASSKVITMRVLSPAVGKPITLKVENSANPAVNMLKTVNTTKAHEWETLTFDFATPTQSSGVANAFVANATFDVISLFPDFMNAETADVSYYFDELTYAIAAGGGAASGPTTAAATPTALAANVLSVYSDAYTPTAGINFFPGWGQSTVDAEVQVAGNNTRKYTNFNYEGITFTPIDVSGMTKLHIDVWTPDMTALDVFILSGAPVEQSIQVQPTKSGWNSFDIDLAGFTNPNKAAIKEMKLVATGGTTMYFDNLYFWKAATTPVSCGTTEPTCAPTTVIPAGAVTIYSESSATAGFNAFPAWGQATQYSEVTLAGNKSLKYSSLNYEGIEFTTVDVSAKGKLHLDVWSAAGATLNVGIITSGKITGGAALETQVPQTLVAGWNSLDIPLTSFTAPNKTKIDQLIFVGAGTIFVDNIYFWDTASAGAGNAGSCTAGVAMGAGGAQTLALSSGDSKGIFAAGEGLFAFDYKGSLDSLGHYAGWVGARSDGTPSCGDIGYFNDTAMSTSSQKLDEGGWVVGTSLDAGGTPNFFRYFVLTAPSSTFASSYIGLFANAPNNGTLNVSTFGSIKFRLWGPAEMYQQSNLNPVVEMVLSGPAVAGCTATGSGGTEISKNVTANLKIGAGSAYKVGLAGFTVKGVCGSDTSGTAVASVLSSLSRVAFTVPASSFNFVNANPGTPVSYSSGINLGPIGFTNN